MINYDLDDEFLTLKKDLYLGFFEKHISQAKTQTDLDEVLYTLGKEGILFLNRWYRDSQLAQKVQALMGDHIDVDEIYESIGVVKYC